MGRQGPVQKGMDPGRTGMIVAMNQDIANLTYLFNPKCVWNKIVHNILSYKMATEVIKKENIVEMPEGADMIAEAMKEVSI